MNVRSASVSEEEVGGAGQGVDEGVDVDSSL